MSDGRPKNYKHLAAVLFIILIGSGAAFLLTSFLQVDTYKTALLAELQRSLNRKVTYDTGVLSFNFGPSLSFTHVVILDKDGVTPFITTDKLTCKIALLPLIEKKVQLKEIILDHPRIGISRDQSGAFNFDDLLEQKGEENPLEVDGLRIKKGQLRFHDLAAGTDPVTFVLGEVDISLNHLTRGRKCTFRISADLADSTVKTTVHLSGSAKLTERNKPLKNSTISADLVAKNLDIQRYWPYYGKFVPFKRLQGQLDVDSVFKGTLAEFTSKGTLKLKNGQLDYPQIFHSLLAPRDLRFTYDMQLDSRDIRIKSIDVDIDGAKVKGSCAILGIPTKDVRITARASSSGIRFEDFHQYIPYGIIVKDTADYIEQHIKGGLFQLDEGTLDGKISQILHMEAGENYNVLAIRARVEKGLLTYGPEVPLFHNIKGQLELRGKDFILHRMTGSFGESPLSLEGKITDYPLDMPSSYPFDMNMTPRQPEIAWLMGKEAGKKLLFSGETKLHLAGHGTTSGYNLSGDWSLTPAQYSYSDIVKKPAGSTNFMSFKGTIDKNKARVSSLIYNLAQMSCEISGGYRFAGKNHLALQVTTNQFQVNDIAPMLPAITSFDPAGGLQAALRSESANGSPTDLHWTGDVQLKAFSFKPSNHFKPISNINGTVSFNGTHMETSQLAAKVGNSIVYCKGSMAGFNQPTISLAFSAPSMYISDLGLISPQKELKVTKLQGNISLYDKNLQIKSLSGQLGNSVASIKGMVYDIDNPRLDISVTSPYLELNDVLLLADIERSGKREAGSQEMMVKASIHADAGKAWDVAFEHLNTSILYENRILYLHPLQLSAFSGHVTGRVRADMGTFGSPRRYQVSYNLDGVSLDRFIQAFGIKKQQATGTLSMQGELTARGHTAIDLKRTALGSVKFKCEKGSLRRFAVLSKIFSILNVSQLFKFQLPDMIEGGMPYKDIIAMISIRDGVASCQDFFIASEAMNISAVGKIDIVNNEIDATIGVQPLQTIEKVVNRIPVVGWILTGDKKTFLTTYFEAKGKLEDPVVKAIPVKSITKGVLNVFRRVFEFPSKLFTDTGEVLIGK